MSDMVEREILQALQTATITAVEASTMNELPIKMLGRSFSPPNDQKYLEVVHIPNNIGGQYWGNEKTYRGLFRLILHWPNNDAGVYDPMNVLASIASHFGKDTILRNGSVSVKILENPNLTGVIESGQETIFPLSMRYQCFRAA